MTPTIESKRKLATPKRIPPLQAGDHLTAHEFERRYCAMPEVKKAELIEGVVYMPSPVCHEDHGAPHLRVAGWIAVYIASTPGTDSGDNSTVRLDADNVPQPDGFLRILPEYGGQTRTSEDGYILHAPELIVEVAASSASYDLHDKLKAYRRNGALEYMVWRVLDEEIDWFRLRDGEYERLEPSAEGVYKSEVFPGLWLDAASLTKNDLTKVLQVLQAGVASPEHAEFVQRLAAQRSRPSETGR